jgi:hypothetical protein
VLNFDNVFLLLLEILGTQQKLELGQVPACACELTFFHSSATVLQAIAMPPAIEMMERIISDADRTDEACEPTMV